MTAHLLDMGLGILAGILLCLGIGAWSLRRNRIEYPIWSESDHSEPGDPSQGPPHEDSWYLGYYQGWDDASEYHRAHQTRERLGAAHPCTAPVKGGAL